MTHSSRRDRNKCVRIYTQWMFFPVTLSARLHVHGRRHKALLSRDASVRRLVAGCIYIISAVAAISSTEDRGGAAVQGS